MKNKKLCTQSVLEKEEQEAVVATAEKRAFSIAA